MSGPAAAGQEGGRGWPGPDPVRSGPGPVRPGPGPVRPDPGKGRPDPDRLYRVYVVVLLACVVAGPAVHAAVTTLSLPFLLDALRSPALPLLVPAGVAGLAASALVVGRSLGPVLGEPFRLQVLAGGPQRRRVSLRPRFLAAGAVVVTVVAVAGAVPTLALIRAGSTGPGLVLVGVAAGALAGVISAVCWLAGQALSPRKARVLTASLVGIGVAASALGLWAGGHWPWGAGRWALAGGSWAPAGSIAPTTLLLTLLAVTATAAAASVPRLLDRLSGPVLTVQASRWRSATTAAGAGDLHGALAAYRPVPSRAPTRPAVGAGPGLALVVLRRDVVGLSRTPGRLLLAVTGTLAAVVLAGLVALLPTQVAWAALAAAAAWGYLALGPVSDGFRHAVEVASAPVLYGVGDHRLLALHALLPTLLVLLAGAAGLALVGLVGSGPLPSLAAGAGLLLGVLVHLYDAAKGPMPVSLLTPVPTPAGDASGIAVALWQVDALLMAVGVPTAVGLLVLTSGPWALLLHLPVAALLLVGVHRRLA